MAERDVRERDILVASNEYAYVQDLTKGDIVLYVGPTKISLSNTERLVQFSQDRFVPLRSEEGGGVSPFISASSSQYIILENPPKDANAKPVKGNNSAIELLNGRKVVVPGPAMFPLWPGQKGKVVDGHALYEDQYLRVRVYDKVDGDNSAIGTEKIVKGAEVSFYIPKTGLEVVPEEKGYVRNAVTLTDGQYCILRGPQNRRRYVRGPAVVFPEAWEDFVTRSGNKVFLAVPLKKDRGLHIRVLKACEAKAGDQIPPGTYRPGQEIFLQEQEGFFFPTDALEVIGEVHAIPLADKEGIYVRHISTGRIVTVVGPKNYLPDPTQVELVQRTLDPTLVALYGLQKHDPKRAISIYIPPSYAVLVTARSKREVVRGPQVRILDYDEDLEVLTLSTGKPKNDEHLLPTCFLLNEGNKVSDIVKVKTADHVELDVALSYRVSFAATDAAGEARWFNVKNYVALLCDHLGSIVRASVRSNPIDAFHANSASVIRSAILGEKKGEEKRTGRHFEENGMLVYDVEVLSVKILDADVEALLADAQRSAITSEVGRKQEEVRLANERLRESVNRQIYEAQLASLAKETELEAGKRNLALAKAEAASEVDRMSRVGRARNEAEALEIQNTAVASAAGRDADVEAKRMQARVVAFKEQMAAMSPELIATLKAVGNQQASAELTRNLAPLAILGGESISDIAERLLASLPLGADGGEALGKLLPHRRTEPPKK
jgi:hypothetical protein